MRELNLNRKRLKGIFLSLCLIIISIGILGAYALHTSPFLSFNSNFAPFIKEHSLNKIEDIKLDPTFSLRLPEFFFPKDENRWQQMQDSVYKALIKNNPAAVEYTEKDGAVRNVKADVIYMPLIDVIKETGLIYLSALVFMISALSVFRKHRSTAGAALALFLLSGSLYLVGSAPVVSRQITLHPIYFKIFIKAIHISAGGMIALVHFAFVFPRPKRIIKESPYLPYIIFYGYFLLTTLFYLSGITAFGTTFPFLFLWTLAMIWAFLHSLIKEVDPFLKKQILLSLIAPSIAGGVFIFLHLLPGVLGKTPMAFTYFALFSLIIPFSLPSAMDNLKLYQERLDVEKNLQMEKERTRQEVHDNLANDLTTIRFLSEVAELSISKEPEKARDNIAAIKDIALKNMEQLRDFLWAIDVEGRGTEDILSQFKTYTARLLDSLDIDIGYRDIHSSNAPRLNTHIRFNLFNIFKEAITNIIKHSRAKSVMVDISYNEKAFEMRIIDDGVGFNLENNTEGSYGLKNMRKRAEEMGGILNIISKEGKGTEIFVVLPQKYLI